jgi:parallel beta-helix repeat protein
MLYTEPNDRHATNRGKTKMILMEKSNPTRLWAILGLLIFSLLLPQANSATYYVATTGSDATGTGSIEAPWATIQKGFDSVTAGDTLYIRGGVYSEAVTAKSNFRGTNGNRITVSAYPNETVTMDGSVAITGWTQCVSNEAGLTVQSVTNPHYANIYKAKVPHSKMPTSMYDIKIFENLNYCRLSRTPDQTYGYGIDSTEFTDFATEGAWPVTGGKTTFVDSDLNQADDYWNGAWIDVFSHLANAWNIRRTISDWDQSDHTGIFDVALDYTISITGGSTPDSYSIANHPHVLDSAGEFYITPTADGNNEHTIYLWPINTDNLTSKITIQDKSTGIYCSYAVRSDYVTLDKISVFGYKSHGISIDGSPETRCENPIVQNCTVRACEGSGIYLCNTNNAIIQDCTVTLVGGRGVFLNTGSNGTIQRCTVSKTGSTNASLYTMDHGVISDCHLYGCVGSHGNGLSCYIGCSEVLVARNIFYDGSNLAYQDLTNSVTYANVFYGNDHMTSIVSAWPDSNLGYYGYHVFLNNTITGSSSNNSLGVPSRMAWTTGYAYSPTVRREVSHGGTNYRCKLAHTATASNEPGTGASWTTYWDITATASPYSYVVNNILDGFDFTADHVANRTYNFYTGYLWNQSSQYGWSLGEGEQYIGTTPLTSLFLDPEGDVFRLKDLSPAIGSGKSITGILQQLGILNEFPNFDFTKDIDGKPWANLPSVGAYEYQPSPNNHAPVLALIGNQSITATQLLTFTVNATDSDGDTIKYSVTGLPQGATFNTTSGAFSWTPALAQIGTHSVTFTARDLKGGVVSETISITVKDPTDNLRAYWKFNEKTGTLAQDSSNNNNTATLVNGPEWTNLSVFTDGSNDYINAGTATFDLASQLTIAIRFKPTGTLTNQQTLIQRGINAYPFIISLNGKTIQTCIRTVNGTDWFNPTTQVQADEWYNVALTYKSGERIVYVNGIKNVDPTPPTGNLVVTAGLMTTIANNGNNGGFFRGFIDEVRIYNSAKSIEEIYAIMNTIDSIENWLTIHELIAKDLSGNPVTFSSVVAGMPKRAAFNPATNTLSWRPWYDQAGSYELLFSAVGSDYTEKVTLDVEDVLLKTWYQEWINDPDTKTAMVEY